MEQKKLVCELINLIKLKKQDLEDKKSIAQRKYETEFPHGASVLQGADINEKYLSTAQKAEIFALYQFLTDNKDLSNEEITTILQQQVRFKNYNKIIKKYPNFLDELKFDGPTYFANLVARDNYLKSGGTRKQL